MRTIKIVNREMEFLDNTFTELEGMDALIQRIKNRLTLWLDEYVLAIGSGIDWFDILNAKPVDTESITRIIKAELLDDPNIISVPEIEVTFNNSSRGMTANFKAESILGTIEEGITV